MSFAKTVEHYLEGVHAFSPGACPGCEDCGLEDCDVDSDEYINSSQKTEFTWSPCECCGSGLGGSRYWAHGFITYDDGTEQLVHFELCYDCFAFLAWGEEPRRTCMGCHGEFPKHTMEKDFWTERYLCERCSPD